MTGKIDLNASFGFKPNDAECDMTVAIIRKALDGGMAEGLLNLPTTHINFDNADNTASAIVERGAVKTKTEIVLDRVIVARNTQSCAGRIIEGESVYYRHKKQWVVLYIK